MVEKLRSILKRIHWSLVLRAAIFALAWFLLPFWLFFFISLYLYLVPLFQARRLAVPFFILLILCYLQGSGIAFLFIFGALFYLLLLIKDLLLIDRRSAFEFLVLALSFLMLRDFFSRFTEGIGGTALLYAFLLATAFAFLFRSFVRCFRDDLGYQGVPVPAATLLSFLVLWQTLIVGLFLPADFIYQSVTVFLIVVLLVDLVPEYIFGGFSREKTLVASMVIFGLFVVVLGSARWGL